MTTIIEVTDPADAMRLMLAEWDRFGTTLAAIEARCGTEFARGIHLAFAAATAAPKGETEPLRARLVCSSLCKHFGFPDPFPEALLEGRMEQWAEGEGEA